MGAQRGSWKGRLLKSVSKDDRRTLSRQTKQKKAW